MLVLVKTDHTNFFLNYRSMKSVDFFYISFSVLFIENIQELINFS